MGFVIKIIVEKVIKYVLSVKNKKLFSNALDNAVDALQRKNKEPGKQIRREVLDLFDYCSNALKKNDGCN